MKSDNFYEMKRCKMDWLDDIFWGTKDSQGLRNATSAIKFVLFDDESQIPDGFTVGDKYEFISSRRDGSPKYAMQSFGIKNKNFDIDYDEYIKIRNKKVIKSDFNDDYITELVAYALMDSVYGGYIFVSSNKFVRNSLINALINERYIEEKWQVLDEFNGILRNPIIDEITKKNYLDSYQRMDDDFLNIKRRDNDYLSYLRDTI